MVWLGSQQGWLPVGAQHAGKLLLEGVCWFRGSVAFAFMGAPFGLVVSELTREDGEGAKGTQKFSSGG